MKLLLHTCCAPCSIYCIDLLKKENIEPTIFWYNPNIHPYKEYESRKNTLEKYVEEIGIKSVFIDKYGLKEFCKNVITDLENRCSNYCYKIRLEEAAKYASENGYDSFSTTLLVSPYQDTEKIIEIGNQIAKKYYLEFVSRDFKQGFREGQAKARNKEMYMQKYCGCIFSEEERYLGKNK